MDTDYIRVKLFAAVCVAGGLGILLCGVPVLKELFSPAVHTNSRPLPVESSTSKNVEVEEVLTEGVEIPQVPVKIDNESFPVMGVLRFIDEEENVVCYTCYRNGISCVKR